MNVFAASLTRLRIGDVFMLDGRLHRVDLVNECRARCIPITRQVRTFVPKTGMNAEKPVQFGDSLNPVSICPNSEIEIVGRWKPETQSVSFIGSEHNVVAAIPPAEEQGVPPAEPDPEIEFEQQNLL